MKITSIYVLQGGCYAGSSGPSKIRIDTTDGMIAKERNLLRYTIFYLYGVEKGEKKD